MADLKKISLNGTEADVPVTAPATDTDYGTIKLNPDEGIDVNADGQLVVDSTNYWGRTEDGGLFYPKTGDPTRVGGNSILISEAKGLSAAGRDLIIAGGNTVNLKVTPQAGATRYEIANTQANRMAAYCWIGGRLAIDQESAAEKTVEILSVELANGDPVLPTLGASVSNNNIVITVAETLNPDGAISTIRGYGTWGNSDILSIGQANKSTGGKCLQVGMNQHNSASQVGMIGNGNVNAANNSFIVGSNHRNYKTFAALFGQGHDTTNAPNGIAAFGQFSQINGDTAFAVGDGTADDARKNLFEVTTDGGIVLRSPNGNRWKLTVDNNGNLATTAL